ncbi:MAG: light-harvesting protein [Granulosicoccus sp.]|nr:light-harvesting protein [Granulosicoccus sp.]
MWRVWLLFDPRRALVGLAGFLFTLAIVIHFIVLSTDRFNWIEGPTASNDISIQELIETDRQSTRLIG